MNVLNYIYISEDDIYKNNNYDISSISNYDLVATALLNVEGVAFCIDDVSQLKDTISIQTLNSKLNKVILNKSISLDTIKNLSTGSSYPLAQYEINNIGIILSDDGVKLIGPCGDEDHFDDFVNRKIVSAEKNNDYLYVYEKQAFARYTNLDSDYPLVNYYKDYNRTSLLEENLDSPRIVIDENNTRNDTPNWDLYDTYKYTFKIVDSNYYLESIKLN